MGKKKTEKHCEDFNEAERPRLAKLTIKNFRGIGKTPVVIELDEIVVLVGPNNCGKSSILRAYQLVMQENSRAGELTLEDFPDGKIDPSNPVEIELESVVFGTRKPAAKWQRKDEISGDVYVREKWVGESVGKPRRYGWNVETGDWAADEVPWGAASVSVAGRPEAHRIEAFDSPAEQAEELVKLLKDLLQDRIKAL